ncbi:hypothetical protein KDD93_02085 [Campylobacter sp. faydin G-24]|uniref:Uncharacterized protein n=1 Tax=Campylobacter anatolicus TaxID=2829105 RepID=A0ABS5HGG1_9BACT|nr:hypothetical protein [Campylobacter anatolicus]MBR8461623.1 hypothetical protein [Campylobacter anatolicus]MBR8463360.1 hypothetical protein [Campylobacter anatolicus]
MCEFNGDFSSDDEIEKLLETAYLAPVSSMHDIRISVTTNLELFKMAEFNKLNLPRYMYNAPIWILVSAKNIHKICQIPIHA